MQTESILALYMMSTKFLADMVSPAPPPPAPLAIYLSAPAGLPRLPLTLSYPIISVISPFYRPFSVLYLSEI